MNEQDPIPTTTTETRPEHMSQAARQAWDTTREKAGEALQTGERYVRENPGTSVASTFACGLLLGVLIGWSIAHEERDSYSLRGRKLARRLADKLSFD